LKSGKVGGEKWNNGEVESAGISISLLLFHLSTFPVLPLSRASSP
jgi:hypothetical protein